MAAETRLYVLDNGVIRLGADNLVTGEGGSGDIPIHSFLIRHPCLGYILFDTACDPRGMDGRWPEGIRKAPYLPGEKGTVPQRLEELGLAPSDVNLVVMSHLHVDHAGCLCRFAGATVLVNGEELAGTLAGYAGGKGDGFHVDSDVAAFMGAGLRWKLIGHDVETMELAKGLTVLNLGPGHSYGMLALHVELRESGGFLLVSDAVYSEANLGPPAKVAGIAIDEAGYLATVERLRRYARESGARMLYGHDMAQFETLIKSTEGYYQ